MARYGLAAMCAALAGGRAAVSAFTAASSPRPTPPAVPLFAGPTETEAPIGGGGGGGGFVNYNAVHVAKSGGVGTRSASEMMGSRSGPGRGLGAPPPRRPAGGTFVTPGGVEIDATVRPLRYTHGSAGGGGGDDGCGGDDDCDAYVPSFFSSAAAGGEGVEGGMPWGSDGAIERLVDLLDHRRGAVLTSSYEFPGR
jgi:hypothetical protein